MSPRTLTRWVAAIAVVIVGITIAGVIRDISDHQPSRRHGAQSSAPT